MGLEYPSANKGTTPDEATSTAYEASNIVSTTQSVLYGMFGYNSLATAQFVQVHDIASLPADHLDVTGVFTGSGLDDVTEGGTFSGSTTNVYVVTIDATGTPDTFSWTKDGGTATTGVAITGGAQTLDNGVTVTFAATTGHTLADLWTITATFAVPVVMFEVQPTSNFSLDLGKFGRWFETGIVVCNSSTGPTKTIGSTDTWFNIQYKPKT